MKTYSKIKKDGRIIAEVCSFLEYPEGKIFLQKVAQNISFRKDIGFAGFLSKEGLKSCLNQFIFGKKKETNWNQLTHKKCVQEIEAVLEKCAEVIGEKKLKIFLFPTINSFIIKKMNGVCGASYWKNTICLFLYKKEKWREELQKQLAHEIAHAIALNFLERKTVLDDLIFEGIAEHFRESYIGGRQAQWTKAISEEKAKKILAELKEKLLTIDLNLSRDLLYGTDKYVVWTGYAIGYYIVKEYLRERKNRQWNELIKIPPKIIYEEYCKIKCR